MIQSIQNTPHGDCLYMQAFTREKQRRLRERYELTRKKKLKKSNMRERQTDRPAEPNTDMQEDIKKDTNTLRQTHTETNTEKYI